MEAAAPFPAAPGATATSASDAAWRRRPSGDGHGAGPVPVLDPFLFLAPLPRFSRSRRSLGNTKLPLQERLDKIGHLELFQLVEDVGDGFEGGALEAEELSVYENVARNQPK